MEFLEQNPFQRTLERLHLDPIDNVLREGEGQEIARFLLPMPRDRR